MTPLPAVFSVVGESDSGKTTVIEGLVAELTSLGLKVGTIKHDVHGFQMDREGKDSYRHKQAGASISLVSSPWQVGMVRDTGRDLPVAELVERFMDGVDVVLTEDYHLERWPKVEVHRRATGKGLRCAGDDTVIAVVSDEPLAVEAPVFGFDRLSEVARLLLGHAGMAPGAATAGRPTS
ncbi:MAG TPA: molybdopterin-guanine dinucleotide biosynthesis protein B [Methylomirabilota bacterium]|nr:molybdopterin-guanine dinucleotide biosynthesis protein B [Methylomirabilota bacterium]